MSSDKVKSCLSSNSTERLAKFNRENLHKELKQECIVRSAVCCYED